MERATIFTAGHSNRPSQDLLAMLGEAGAARLVDVRRYPRSRFNPQFNERALAAALRAAGIDYRHAPELGGRREAAAEPSPNDGWEPGAFRNYADYALTPAFQAALTVLEAEAAAGPVAIMCAEKDWRQCHRQIIADYLLSRGHPVVHLIEPGAREPAAPDPRLVRAGDGGLYYRAPPPAQRELF